MSTKLVVCLGELKKCSIMEDVGPNFKHKQLSQFKVFVPVVRQLSFISL